MTQPSSESPWLYAGASVRGHSHKLAALLNQDAIQLPAQAEHPYPLVLAVADGHGSRKCFRSHKGAAFATEIAMQVLGGIGDPTRENGELTPQTVWLLETDVPRRICRGWNEKVDEDLKFHPFAEDDKRHLTDIERKSIDDHPATAYGATLLAVLITRKLIAYVQIGDGEILTVSDSGEVSSPLPADDRLFANETTSLAGSPKGSSKRPGSATAATDFRIRCIPRKLEEPRLILITTDGYPNSFNSQNDFLKVGGDLIRLIDDEGFDTVQYSLPGWLEQASAEGSGDDVTLGLIYRAKTPETPSYESPSTQPEPAEPEPNTTDKTSSASLPPVGDEAGDPQDMAEPPLNTAVRQEDPAEPEKAEPFPSSGAPDA